MWELGHKAGWALKKWYFWTVVLKKTLESPLDCKEVQPVNPKGNLSWILIGRTDTEAEASIPWPADAKSELIRKDPDAGTDWRQEEKSTMEDEMVGWHHWLNGHEFEQAPGDSEGQGSLACCSPWGRRESDLPEQQQYLKKLCWKWLSYYELLNKLTFTVKYSNCISYKEHEKVLFGVIGFREVCLVKYFLYMEKFLILTMCMLLWSYFEYCYLSSTILKNLETLL